MIQPLTQPELWPVAAPCLPRPYVVVSLDLASVSHPDHLTDARGVHYVEASGPRAALLAVDPDDLQEGDVPLVAFAPEDLRRWASRLADVPPRPPADATGVHAGEAPEGYDDGGDEQIAHLVVCCDLREIDDERDVFLGECQLHLTRATHAEAAARRVKAGLPPSAVALPGFSAEDLEAMAEECQRAASTRGQEPNLFTLA